MKTNILTLCAIIISLIIFYNFSISPDNYSHNQLQDSTAIIAKKNYANYCASCHYDDLTWFVTRKWKYGHSVGDIFTSIKTGYPDFGMPSYKNTFIDKEITAISEYIHTRLELGEIETAKAQLINGCFKTEKLNIKPDTIIKSLNVPWGMTFLPDGDMLVCEREGKMLRFRNGEKVAEIQGLPKIQASGQGGLMDIILHPDYKRNGWIYFSYTSPGENNSEGWNTAIMRAKLKNNALIDKQLIFKAIPDTKAGHHFGCRIVFDEKKHIFFSVGDRGNSMNAQDLTNDCGKIHRLNDDGSIPKDNPFVKTQGARKNIWSYGHRNPQGLVISPFTGILWESEHGPKGGDELNLVLPGKNYGWPVISFGINYDGTILTRDTAKTGMEQPISYWVPSFAPCGMAFLSSKKYKGWEGNILMGSLRFRNLERCELSESKVIHKETLLHNIGRLRNVIEGPDGYIYVAVEYPGIIIRLIRVE